MPRLNKDAVSPRNTHSRYYTSTRSKTVRRVVKKGGGQSAGFCQTPRTPSSSSSYAVFSATSVHLDGHKGSYQGVFYLTEGELRIILAPVDGSRDTSLAGRATPQCSSLSVADMWLKLWLCGRYHLIHQAQTNNNRPIGAHGTLRRDACWESGDWWLEALTVAY
jgi:hypothetical protein